jgi:spermidine synthase
MNDSAPLKASRSLVLAIALVSAATLAVQVLQTRLFSVMLWHHLTYMVVTITLLGFAAGGTLLALLPGLGRAHGDARVAVSFCCSLFSLTLIGAFSILAHGQLDTLDIDRDRTQYFWLFAQYAYLLVPFVFAGLAVAIALNEFPGNVHRTYFWNLIGSGIGSFLFVLLVRPLGGPGCLFWFASLAGLGGLVAVWGERSVSLWPARLLAFLALVPGPLASLAPAVADRVVPIEPAPSKAQTLFQKFFDASERVLRSQDPAYQGVDRSLRHSRWTPLCRLDTLPVPPSIEAARRDRDDPAGAPRAQVHVFQDGDAPTVIWSRSHARDNDFDKHFYGLGYRLVSEPRVLIIGPGGGNDVETALHYGARDVEAVEINGDTLALVRSEFGAFTGHVYGRPNVRAVHSEGRSHLRRAGGTYDLIQMSGTDTYAALSSGSYIFSESYLYTEEAFDDYFAHLSDNGVIAIIRFRFEPPRETLKLVATGARALQRLLNVQDVRRHFIVVNQVDAQAMTLAAAMQQAAVDPQLRDLVATFKRYHDAPLRYSFTLMRKTPFSAADVAEIEGALPAMNVPPVVNHEVYYAAGTRAQPQNEYARLLAAMAEGRLAEREFFRTYPYRAAPASDDKPFFFSFHSWGDVLRLRPADDKGYTALTGSEPIGLYILAALLAQTLLATLVLVIVPLFRLGFRATDRVQSRSRTLLYFLALGLAYLLVEISTIQRFVLYLGHPTYSLTAGLAVFLVFSGLGSATAGALRAGPRLAAAAALAVVLLLIAQAIVVPDVLRRTLAWDETRRLAVTVACIGPVAFVMGMPFPSGLKILRDDAPGMIPWAFGVNGAASVLASILSIVVAMEAGFTVVALLAAGLYLLAALTVPRAPAAPDASEDPDGDVPALPAIESVS